MTKRKRIKRIVNELDLVLVGLRELATCKVEGFDGDLWLAIYKTICDITEGLEKGVK